MSRARYDDELPMNRKVIWLRSKGVNGIAALGLHLLANTYCRHNGTAGHIEPHVPETLVGSCWRKLVNLLVEVGMFDEVDDGWEIHDYAEYHDPNDPDPNRSAADRKREISEKRAEAGRKGGYAKAGKTSGKATDLPEAKSWQTSGPIQSLSNPNSESSITTHHHPHGSTDDDDRFTPIIEAIAEARITKWPSQSNPLKHRATVIQSVLEQHGPAVRAMLDHFPSDADAQMVIRRIKAEGKIA